MSVRSLPLSGEQPPVAFALDASLRALRWATATCFFLFTLSLAGPAMLFVLAPLGARTIYLAHLAVRAISRIAPADARRVRWLAARAAFQVLVTGVAAPAVGILGVKTCDIDGACWFEYAAGFGTAYGTVLSWRTLLADFARLRVGGR